MRRARWPIKAIYDAERKKPWRLSLRDPGTRAVGPRLCSAGSTKERAGGGKMDKLLDPLLPPCS